MLRATWLRVVTIVTVLFTAWGIWELRAWLARPSATEVNIQRYSTWIWDDSCSPEDMLFVGAVAVNQSTALAPINPDDVHNDGLTVRAPSQDGQGFKRTFVFVDWWSSITGGSRAMKDSREAAVAVLTRDPKVYDLRKYPWLGDIRRMYRGCDSGAWQTFAKLDALVNECGPPVHTTASGSKYFKCSK